VKELIIIRHAKSSWDDPLVRDHDRTLNERGRRDAPVMAKWLADHCKAPDLAIVSTAVRAQETSKYFLEAFGMDDAGVVHSKELYRATEDDVLDLLKWVPRADMKRVMIIGHNPTLTFLVDRLIGPDVGDLPTCAVVVIRFPHAKDWSKMERGELVLFASPKKLSE
jgi:phosphohistidine phosphatase